VANQMECWLITTGCHSYPLTDEEQTFVRCLDNAHSKRYRGAILIVKVNKIWTNSALILDY